MKLHSIKLHPFGRFADQSWDLAKPLIVIHGPNELGKTTLRQAIFHALFTPTNLTARPFEKSVKPWLPLPGGDHAQVTLALEHEGTAWTLEKRWGAAQMSRLSDGTTAIADPAAVQQRLGEMLVHGEATYRHVLFTGQAELERTFLTIREKEAAGELRDIGDLLQAAVDSSADVDEQALRRKVAEKIEDAFGRWDDANGRPERQNGKEKGLSDPWKKGVGDILRAWYAWKILLAERDRILDRERQLDDISTQAAALEEEIRTLTAFIEKYGGLRQSLGDRAVLEERIPRLRQDVAGMTAAFTGWPQATATIDAWNQLRPTVATQLADVQKERAHAQAKENAAALLRSFAAIREAKSDWEKAVEAATAHPHPGNDILSEIDQLEGAIRAAENKLAARSLSWRIESEKPTTVVVERGAEPAETISFGPEPAAGQATARMRVQAGGITLSVESGEEDVDALFTAIDSDRAALATQLAACNAASPQAARERADRHRDSTAAAASRKAVYEGLLQGKSFEQWETEVQAVESLPATRDITTIDAEIARITTQLAEGDAQAKKHEESITNWKTQHEAHETLTTRLLEAKAAVQTADTTLASLPGLPEGFASVRAFLDALDSAQQALNPKQQQLLALRQSVGQLNGELGDARSEDVTEQAAAAERVFNRARTQGRAYRRIEQELDHLAGAADVDPLADFSERVSGLFSRITCGEADLQFDGQLPASVVRGAISLPPDRLSQGGGGALALAVRLAMAEAYLQGHGGFIMLDDPLVHFDKDRMAIAADVLRAFSATTQVLFFTCHDHQAARLEGEGVLPAPGDLSL
ncbi:MAG: AAA family ATPase [Pirellulales bacterium]|nr:AAA family ATPase [Pirellulales bacterium]